jgi:hypothetical protein
MSFPLSLIDSMYLSQFRDPRTGVVDDDEVERFEQQEAENENDVRTPPVFQTTNRSNNG